MKNSLINLQKIKRRILAHKIDLALYVTIGFLAFFIDYFTLQLLYFLSHKLLIATTMGLIAGLSVSYALNHLRFRKRHSETKKVKESLPAFIALFTINTMFTYVCLLINEKNHWVPRIFAKAFATSIIILWNYLAYHYVIFRRRGEI
jgi:putative flippase GtrA